MGVGGRLRPVVASSGELVLGWGEALLDLVLPAECAGCHRAGTRWCARCSRALASLAFEPSAVGQGVAARARLVVPRPAPRGLPSVWAWGVYADPLRTAMSAWKDGGRRDLEGLLVPLLRSSLMAAGARSGWADGPVLVVPAPSSRRSLRARGDVPLVGLCRAVLADVRDTPSAGRGPDLHLSPALEHVRSVRDQSSLDTLGRRSNLHGSMSAKPLWRTVIAGRRCVVIDDVVTTGATLAEAARALRAAGASAVVAATMAATQRTPRGADGRAM